jgi:hypothetical protein
MPTNQLLSKSRTKKLKRNAARATPYRHATVRETVRTPGLLKLPTDYLLALIGHADPGGSAIRLSAAERLRFHVILSARRSSTIPQFDDKFHDYELWYVGQPTQHSRLVTLYTMLALRGSWWPGSAGEQKERKSASPGRARTGYLKAKTNRLHRIAKFCRLRTVPTSGNSHN